MWLLLVFWLRCVDFLFSFSFLFFILFLLLALLLVFVCRKDRE